MAEIILALDVDSADAGRRLLDRLPDLRWVKVGSVLMTREGAPFLVELRARGLELFLDLKWHDIPNTVAGAVSAAAALGVSMATVHTLGGAPMLAAAHLHVVRLLRFELDPLADRAFTRCDEHRDHGRAATPHHPASISSSISV